MADSFSSFVQEKPVMDSEADVELGEVADEAVDDTVGGWGDAPIEGITDVVLVVEERRIHVHKVFITFQNLYL